jgi:Hg(II)-responsive transcriptional regulator
MRSFTIGQIARQTGVGIETIRFYERQGLVPEPPRTPAGYRQYGEDAVERLRFIQRAKELGFSLKETEELIALRLGEGVAAEEVRARAEAKIRDVEAKIRDLDRIRATLQKLAEACLHRGESAACPILGALVQGEDADG